MKSQSKYSICIPSYRRKNELLTLMNSIRTTVPIVVSDNESYLSEQPELRKLAKFVGKRGPAIPIFENWNNAVRHSETEYFLIPSDDDIYYENSFEVIDDAMKKYPDRDLYIFGHNLVDEQYKIVGTWIPNRFEDYPPGQGIFPFIYGVHCRMPSVVIKRVAFERAGGFNESMTVTAGDSELIHKILLSGTSTYIPEIVSGYRVWASSSTNLTNSCDRWFAECAQWCNTIKLSAESLYGKKFLPPDFKARIMYRNVRSAYSTVKRNRGQLAAIVFATRKIPLLLALLKSFH